MAETEYFVCGRRGMLSVQTEDRAILTVIYSPAVVNAHDIALGLYQAMHVWCTHYGIDLAKYLESVEVTELPEMRD